MEMPSFSLIVVCSNTKEVFFKDCLESVIAQKYDKWEMYIIDDDVSGRVEKITKEFFPRDTRVHYRKIKNHKGKAYALNIGFHFAEGDYVIPLNSHDRLDAQFMVSIADAIVSNNDIDVVYSDHSDLEGIDITNIHIKQDLNVELLLRTNYIGNVVAIRRGAIKNVGLVREALEEAYIYEYLLRCVEKKLKFFHISKFLYYKRITFDSSYERLLEQSDLGSTNEQESDGLKGIIKSIFSDSNVKPKSKNNRVYDDLVYKEEMASANAYLIRNNIKAEIKSVPSGKYWKIIYDGSDVYKHSKDYIMIKDRDVKVSDKHFLEKLYGYIKQKDIAVVGARFAKPFWMVENSGYIYSDEGEIYPAFYNTKLRDGGYENIQLIPREIGMVDGAFCMISKKAYRSLGGFDSSLSGRDIMLDFCIRARAKGYRVVIDPSIVVRKRELSNVSEEKSHNILLEKVGDEIKKGDKYYSKNFVMGLNNHVIEEAEN